MFERLATHKSALVIASGNGLETVTCPIPEGIYLCIEVYLGCVCGGKWRVELYLHVLVGVEIG